MSLAPIQRLSAAIVGRRELFNIVRRNHNGIEGPRIHSTLAMLDGTSIAAVNLDKQFVLVQRYRHGMNDVTRDVAGGFVDGLAYA